MATKSDLDKAIAHHQSGELERAKELYENILQSNPEDLNAQHLLGVVHTQLGSPQLALDFFDKIISKLPDKPEFHVNKGLALQKLGNYDGAKKSYMTALQLNPNQEQALFNIGVVAQKMQDYANAEKYYKAVLELKPDYIEAINNLGNSQHALKYYHAALITLQSGLDLSPDSARLHNNIGVVYLDGYGDRNVAKQHFMKAKNLDSNFLDATFNLGIVAKLEGNYSEAIEYFNSLLQLKPDNNLLKYQLATAYIQIENYSAALKLLRNVINDGYFDVASIADLFHIKRNLFDWDGLEELEIKLNELLAEEPFIYLSRSECLQTHLQLAKKLIDKIKNNTQHLQAKFNFEAVDKKILNIGYISGDLHEHAIAHLILDLLTKHDRTKFKITIFSYGKTDLSLMQHKIQQAADKLIDLKNMNTLESAYAINKEGIDILVDLKGHTQANRMEILALQPAPIQINYLGYPGTSGADFIDYILADATVCPLEDQQFYSEKILHLPNCYQISQQQQRVFDNANYTKDSFNLPANKIILGAFHQGYKIEGTIFNVWLEILLTYENTHLWILMPNIIARENFKNLISSCGLAANRVTFADFIPKPLHLARLKLIDLMLDTKICNGHTTTSDAIYMGIPVVTIYGKHFASRASSSILLQVGLRECIARDLLDYKNIIVNLINKPEKIKQLKKKLDANKANSNLFNPKQFATDLEAVYQKIWQNYIKQ